MPTRGEEIPDSRKPTVGIIYTDSETNSLESKSLAFFLAASLAYTGYAKVNLTGLRTDGAPCVLEHQHKALCKGSISFLPAGKSSSYDIQTESVTINDGSGYLTSNSSTTNWPKIRLSHWNDLQYCQVIIVTVNSDDSEACCSKLAAVLPFNLYQVVVISLQRGVKNGGILKEGLKNIETKVSVSTASRNEKERTEKNVVAVVEGLVGFACVPVLFSSQLKIAAPGPQIHSSHRVSDPSTSSGITASSSSSSPSHYYACTLRSPQIVLERLSKDIADLANGPVNLIESIGIDLQFRKTLTPFAWGILLYENFHALNAITGGDLVSTISCRRNRLILALMIRESRETLLKAARGGKWYPDLSLISFHLTPWIFEMALAVPLPGPCYHLFWILINLIGGCFLLSGNLCSRGVCSPEQCDLIEGRKTMSDLHIAEIVLAGGRYKVETPMCSAVLSTIRTLENTTIAPNTDKTYSFVTADTYAASNAVKGRMSVIDKAYTSRTGDVWYRHPSVWESTYRCTQIGIIILTLFMLLTILYEVLES